MYFSYRFPAIVLPEGTTLSDQADYIIGEAQELKDAAMVTETHYEVDVEAMDVIHAAETFLRMRGHSDDALNHLAQLVIEKNQRRGYYEGSEK